MTINKTCLFQSDKGLIEALAGISIQQVSIMRYQNRFDGRIDVFWLKCSESGLWIQVFYDFPDWHIFSMQDLDYLKLPLVDPKWPELSRGLEIQDWTKQFLGITTVEANVTPLEAGQTCFSLSLSDSSKVLLTASPRQSDDTMYYKRLCNVS